MPISEVFPKATVKSVVFQIRFPNLFFIESKMGEFQLKILERLPKSALLLQRNIMLADLVSDAKVESFPTGEEPGVRKIWQFSSENDAVVLNVLTNSMDISSKHHKTYDNLASPDRFRDVIGFVLEAFRVLIPIPVLSRVGLRYTDECPIPGKDNDAFRLWYNTAIPLDRISLAQTEEAFVRTSVKKDDFLLTYQEALNRDNLTLDFDASATAVPMSECLSVTDSLHALISEEFLTFAREPFLKYLRGQEEN